METIEWTKLKRKVTILTNLKNSETKNNTKFTNILRYKFKN